MPSSFSHWRVRVNKVPTIFRRVPGLHARQSAGATGLRLYFCRTSAICASCLQPSYCLQLPGISSGIRCVCCRQPSLPHGRYRMIEVTRCGAGTCHGPIRCRQTGRTAPRWACPPPLRCASAPNPCRQQARARRSAASCCDQLPPRWPPGRSRRRYAVDSGRVSGRQ